MLLLVGGDKRRSQYRHVELRSPAKKVVNKAEVSNQLGGMSNTMVEISDIMGTAHITPRIS